MATGTSKAAIGYARVSTDGQAEHGESLELQQVKVRAMAEVQGVDLLDLVIDAGESAKSLARPGMARLLELVQSGTVDRVIVYKLDRLTRSVGDLAELLVLFDRHGVALVSVSESLDTGTAAGRLVLNVMASVAQWEREVIGERTREALAAKRAKGQRVGRLPFGYTLADDGVTLTADPAEQRALAIVRELRDAGYTLAAIADELNRQGYTTREGGRWQYQNVQNLLTDPEVRRRWRKASEARKARAAIAA